MKPVIALVVAMDENGIIGRDGDLPWRLPADLAYFKRTTLEKPVIMGRKTYESIGRPLPRRHNIVLTRTIGFEAPGCTVVHDLDAALHAAGGEGAAPASEVAEVMVIGGAQIYATALPLASRIYLTRVHATCSGDTSFPELDPTAWREVRSERRAADDRNEHAMTFQVLERAGTGGD